MIAKILVKKKIGSKAVFDYKIPEGVNVENFSIVEVPFNNKIEIGLIVGVSEKSKFATKEIKRILSSGPCFSPNQLKLAQYISKEYICSLGETLLGFMPPLNKRDIFKIGGKSRNITFAPSKPTVYIADRDSRITYFCQLTGLMDGQHLLICPTILLANIMSKKISNLFPEKKIHIWHSKLKSEQKSYIWQDLLSGSDAIVVGTRQSMFLPFSKLRTVYIDDPTNFAYREEQSPYYNSYEVAIELSRIFGSNLVIGQSTTDILSFVAIKKNIFQLKTTNTSLGFNIFPAWSKGINDPNFFSMINTSIAGKQKVAIVGFFKQDANYICDLCKTISKDKNQCPECKSKKLRTHGFSYEEISSQIKTIFKNVNVGFGVSQIRNSDIIIFNSLEIELLNEKIETFIFPFFDHLLSNSEIGSMAKLFRFIRELPSFGGRKVCVFGDNLSENDFISQIKNNDFNMFYTHELIQRRKIGLPPYKKVFIVGTKNKSEDKAQQIIDKFLETELPSKIGYLKKSKTKNDIFTVEKIHFLEKRELVIIQERIIKTNPKGLYFKISPIEFI